MNQMILPTPSLSDATQRFLHAPRRHLIGGTFVLRNGDLVGIDWPRIATRARAAAARLAEANAEARATAEALAPIISQFCVGLGRCAHDLPRKLSVP